MIAEGKWTQQIGPTKTYRTKKSVTWQTGDLLEFYIAENLAPWKL